MLIGKARKPMEQKERWWLGRLTARDSNQQGATVSGTRGSRFQVHLGSKWSEKENQNSDVTI